MSLLNKTIKLFGYVGIYLILLIEMFLIAFISMGTVMSVYCSIWSFFRPIPCILSAKFGIAVIIVSIPVTIALFIYSIINVKKK